MKKYTIRYLIGSQEKVFSTDDVFEFSSIIGVLSKLDIDYNTERITL